MFNPKAVANPFAVGVQNAAGLTKAKSSSTSKHLVAGICNRRRVSGAWHNNVGSSLMRDRAEMGLSYSISPSSLM